MRGVGGWLGRVGAAALTVLLAVGGLPPATALAATPLSSFTASATMGVVYGGDVTVTATASPADATGVVTFTVDGVPVVPAVPLAGGVASVVLVKPRAGDHRVSAAYSGDGTYNPASDGPRNVTVARAPLTVTADGASRAYGSPNPTFTTTISGFVNGETAVTAGVTGSAACATTATLTSPAGTYPITCATGSLAAINYGFTFVAGALVVVRGASSVTLSPATTIFETGTPAVLTATVEPAVAEATPSGSLVFTIDGVAEPAVTLDPSGRGSVTVIWTTPGLKSVEVSYAGDGSFAAPGTASAAPSVVANTARATGVGVSAATFYPIADAWRDTVTARGIRSERLALTIEVKNANGTVVRRYSAGSAAGAYAWAWNGRTSKGVLVPAGRYTIVQTLIDSYGSRPRQTVISTVAVSLRKIQWTTKSITSGPGPRCFQFSSGDGVGSNSCASTAPLRLAGDAGHWPGVGYQFLLPPASGYRSIRIELLGTSTGRRPAVGFHDWTLGSAWGQLYRPGWRRTAISPNATRWSGVTVADPGSFISGRSVRAYVDGGGRLASAFAFEIVRVRLVVSVGILQ